MKIKTANDCLDVLLSEAECDCIPNEFQCVKHGAMDELAQLRRGRASAEGRVGELEALLHVMARPDVGSAHVHDDPKEGSGWAIYGPGDEDYLFVKDGPDGLPVVSEPEMKALGAFGGVDG